jgi:hypothetical protein
MLMEILPRLSRMPIAVFPPSELKRSITGFE